jgi:hypothetical protein
MDAKQLIIAAICIIVLILTFIKKEKNRDKICLIVCYLNKL